MPLQLIPSVFPMRKIVVTFLSMFQSGSRTDSIGSVDQDGEMLKITHKENKTNYEPTCFEKLGDLSGGQRLLS
jgi:hypothetical protein